MTRVFGRLIVLGLVGALWVACGPDNGSNGNDNQQADAYVFPDTGPRPDAAACEDRCVDGERQCVTGGYQECGNFDSDECTEWGPVVACNPGDQCNPANGNCESGGCTDECTEGSIRCGADGVSTESCEEDTGTGCMVWGDPVACPGGETCSAGSCSSTCVDECTQGSQQCSGNGYQVCGPDFDSDSCMDWGPVTNCPAGETCSDGYCAAECSNECTAGSTRCDGTTGTQACGNYDSDVCLEWGPTVPCPTGETCSNGACDINCTDECAAMNDTQCTTSGGGYQVCDFWNASPCLVWGTAVSCAADETCVNGACELVCDCDITSGICEPESPGSTTACSCDTDCNGGVPCDTDGHCDTWCPPGADLDCDCACDYNEYCEAASNPSTDTCACDPDCEPNEWACSDDGHCDSWCTAGADQDCGEDPCRDRWMEVGYRYADETWLAGAYDDPDTTVVSGSPLGAPWVLLSPGLSSGSAEAFVEFAEEHSSCVDSILVDAWGYDDSVFGDGAEFYIYNWDTFQFDLLPDQTIGDSEWVYENYVIDPTPYLLCGSGPQAKCYIDVQVGASAWDNTHLYDLRVSVHTTP